MSEIFSFLKVLTENKAKNVFSFLQTTPGHYLDQGQLLAAKLCKMWGLDLLSTKYALEAAYDIMKVSNDISHVHTRVIIQVQLVSGGSTYFWS